MSRHIVRFLGDPRGYEIDLTENAALDGWHRATIGNQTVLIDLDHAYLIENLEDEPDEPLITQDECDKRIAEAFEDHYESEDDIL